MPAHQRVHFVEEFGQFLDLVDDHGLPPVRQRGALLDQQSGVGREPAKFPGREQVVGGRIGKEVAQQRTLSGLSRPPQEARLGGERVCREKPPDSPRHRRFSLRNRTAPATRRCLPS